MINMDIISGRQQLIDAISDLGQGQAEVSYALVFVTSGDIAVDDIIAIKEAVRLCDVAIVACVDKSLSPNHANLVAEAGAKILYTHKKTPISGNSCGIRLKGGADITSFLQIALLVMPSVVVVADENLETMRVAKSIENTFNQLFTVIQAKIPADILNAYQQELTATLLLAQDVIDQGERRSRVVLQQVVTALETNGFRQIRNLMLVDSETLLEVSSAIPKNSFLFAEIIDGEKLLRRTVSLKS